MKTQIQRRSPEGSVLLLTLLTALIVGISLSTYFYLVSNQNRAAMRALSWNSCVPLAEAGVEEALTQVNYWGINNLTQDSWTLNADGLYHKVRTLGTDGSYYDVGIQNTDPPVITSSGYVPAPANPLSYFGTLLATGAPSGSSFIRRTVQVGTVRQAAGAGGINAKGAITFSGSGYLDSFDSSNTNYSGANGVYDSTKRKSNGKAMSNGTALKTIQVGTGKIYGSADTGPGGTITYGAGGAVGDASWIALGNVGGQSGHIANDANVAYQTPAAPFTFGTAFTPSGGTVSGYGATNFSYVVDGNVSSTYNISTVSVSNGANPMLVRGNVTLYVSGDMTVSGSGFIYIAPGSNVKIYVGGKFTVSGSGVVNATNLAKDLYVYGLSTTTGKAWTYSGSADFIGVMNAPLVALTVSGGASGIGSFTANTFTLSGSGHISYDENLSTGGAYVPSSWNEL